MSEFKNSDFGLSAESLIPDDLLTPTLGSNYGLDGYPDMDYGMGVLEGVLDPDLTPSPAFPTGLSRSGSEEGFEGFDLTAMLEEGSREASIVDLDWLDPTQLQDPERLPESSHATVIPELEEAWRSTDRMPVHARDLKRAQYEESLSSQNVSAAPRPGAIAAVVRRAMRRSAAGEDLKAILREAVQHLGTHLKAAGPALLRVKEEHGLAGNVFLRASAYPGYEQGKYKKLAKTGARYLLVDEKTLRNASWIQDGRCIYTKKLAVSEIPWREAIQFYRGRLGKKTAATINSRETLRAAFLAVPEAVRVDSGFLPKHDPSIREGFLAKGGETPVVYDRTESRVAKGVRKIEAAIERGTHGAPLRAMISRTFLPEDRSRAVQKLSATLKRTGALNDQVKAPSTYEGRAYEVHSLHKSATFEGAVLLTPPALGAIRWIRKAMSEGFAGKTLDSLIHQRFASEVLTEIEAPLRQIRAEHEGASGFIYVDAEAYATPRGVKGCEDGALKHRSNQIPSVAAMDRCASCTLAAIRPDGTRKCSTYNKALLEDRTGFEKFKKANIRVSNMNDAEQTAAMFAPPQNGYDPSEYGLKNSNLEELEVDLPESEKMADVLFGGWTL